MHGSEGHGVASSIALMVNEQRALEPFDIVFREGNLVEVAQLRMKICSRLIETLGIIQEGWKPLRALDEKVESKERGNRNSRVICGNLRRLEVALSTGAAGRHTALLAVVENIATDSTLKTLHASSLALHVSPKHLAHLMNMLSRAPTASTALNSKPLIVHNKTSSDLVLSIRHSNGRETECSVGSGKEVSLSECGRSRIVPVSNAPTAIASVQRSSEWSREFVLGAETLGNVRLESVFLLARISRERPAGTTRLTFAELDDHEFADSMVSNVKSDDQSAVDKEYRFADKKDRSAERQSLSDDSSLIVAVMHAEVCIYHSENYEALRITAKTMKAIASNGQKLLLHGGSLRVDARSSVASTAIRIVGAKDVSLTLEPLRAKFSAKGRVVLDCPQWLLSDVIADMSAAWAGDRIQKQSKKDGKEKEKGNKNGNGNGNGNEKEGEEEEESGDAMQKRVYYDAIDIAGIDAVVSFEMGPIAASNAHITVQHCIA